MNTQALAGTFRSSLGIVPLFGLLLLGAASWVSAAPPASAAGLGFTTGQLSFSAVHDATGESIERVPLFSSVVLGPGQPVDQAVRVRNTGTIPFALHLRAELNGPSGTADGLWVSNGLQAAVQRGDGGTVFRGPLSALDTLIRDRLVSQDEEGFRVSVWLEPNADAGSRDILAALDQGGLPPGSQRLTHVPRALFASAMRHCAVLAGNSSAGIIEAASFGTPVVNIGDRQRLRERNPNVADAAAEAGAIEAALRSALGHGAWPCDNLWGDGRAGERIAALLATLPAGPQLLEKINVY